MKVKKHLKNEMRSDIEENLIFGNILIFLQEKKKYTRARTLVYGMKEYFYLPKHEDSNMRKGAQKCQRKSASTIWYALKNLGAL